MGNFRNYLTLVKPRNFVLRKRRSYSEIGAVFGIVPRLLIGPYGRPTIENGAYHIGLAQ